MRAGNSCKKSLSLREFSVRVILVFLLIACLVSPAAAVDFWDITVVDSNGSVGRFTSLAVLPSGHPAISYYDNTNKQLKYAWYDGSAWQTTTVDSTGHLPWYTSLAILPSGQPAIAYRDATNKDQKYAWHDGSVWQTTIVDSTGDVGGHTGLAILPSGHPAISYYDWTNGNLKYAWYNGNTWQTNIVDSVGDVGRSTSLVVLHSGHPAISYYDLTNNNLKYAWYDGSIWQTTTVDSEGTVGFHTSLAILPSGQPAISYWQYSGDNLKYAWYDGSAWQTTTVDSEGRVGMYTSLAILPSGKPAISYFANWISGNATVGDLKYACYDGSMWQTTTVDAVRDVGSDTSLAILPSGQPAISYYDWSCYDLKFASPPDVPSAPVGMTPSYTATAWTELGGANTVPDGPAYNEGWGAGFEVQAHAKSLVNLETTPTGHLRGVIALAGEDGEECWEECMEWDPETMECLWWEWICFPMSCGDANGTVTGTIILGTSESYPAGSYLDLALQAIISGDSGDTEDYHLKLWRGVSLLGQVDPCAPDGIIVGVEAGETLTFELFASEEDWSGDYDGYDYSFEFRLILRGPTNFDGLGTVDFRDYAIFALHWLDTGCVDPTWCGKADLDKSTDVNWPDLKIFTDHWLE